MLLKRRLKGNVPFGVFNRFQTIFQEEMGAKPFIGFLLEKMSY